MKDHEPCRNHANGTDSPSTQGTRDDESSTAAPAVVSIGDRPVVEIGAPAVAPEPFIPAKHSPDRDWDRSDDYATTGFFAHKNDMDRIADERREERDRRGDWPLLI